MSGMPILVGSLTLAISEVDGKHSNECVKNAQSCLETAPAAITFAPQFKSLVP
jgi:hypothetical protein